MESRQRTRTYLCLALALGACLDDSPPQQQPPESVGTVRQASEGTATVTADRADYSPGDTALISGTGWAAGETVDIAIGDGSTIAISPDDVDLAQDVMEGWGVASEAGVTVALELEITPDLRLEGIARELVRVLQDARKAAGLEISDRIVAGVRSGGDVADALEAHRDLIAGEVLARELVSGPVPDATFANETELEGSAVRIELRRA